MENSKNRACIDKNNCQAYNYGRSGCSLWRTTEGAGDEIESGQRKGS